MRWCEVMRTTVSKDLGAAQAKAVSGDAQQSLMVRCLRQALDNLKARQGATSKHAAVAAAIGISAPMFSEVLSEIKPLRAVYVDRLPEDVRQEFALVFAEACGLVVAPRLSEAEALAFTLRGVLALQHARNHQPSTNQE